MVGWGILLSCASGANAVVRADAALGTELRTEARLLDPTKDATINEAKCKASDTASKEEVKACKKAPVADGPEGCASVGGTETCYLRPGTAEQLAASAWVSSYGGEACSVCWPRAFQRVQ